MILRSRGANVDSISRFVQNLTQTFEGGVGFHPAVPKFAGGRIGNAGMVTLSTFGAWVPNFFVLMRVGAVYAGLEVSVRATPGAFSGKRTSGRE